MADQKKLEKAVDGAGAAGYPNLRVSPEEYQELKRLKKEEKRSHPLIKTKSEALEAIKKELDAYNPEYTMEDFDKARQDMSERFASAWANDVQILDPLTIPAGTPLREAVEAVMHSAEGKSAANRIHASDCQCFACTKPWENMPDNDPE